MVTRSSHEIKILLLPGRKTMTNLDRELKKQRYHFVNKDPYSQSYGFLVGFPGGSVVKNPPASAGSLPGLGRFPGGGNGNSHHYSCLKNPMDRGAW